MATYIEMQREAYTRINQAVLDNANTILGYNPQVFFEGVVRHNVKPSNDRLYINVETQNLTESQESITSDTPGSQAYLGFGSVVISLFVPKNKNTYALKSKELAQHIRNSLRGQGANADVWFSNQTVRENRPSRQRPRMQVISEYNYYENI